LNVRLAVCGPREVRINLDIDKVERTASASP
jgi:hypothetical protein